MLRRRSDPSFVAEIVPSRGLEGSMSAARGMLGALVGEAFALDLALTADGPRWYVRSDSADGMERVLAQVRAAYPQAAVERCTTDPLTESASAEALAVELRPAADAALPLRLEWRGERDPLTGVVAAVEPAPGEQVVCRLRLGPAPSRGGDRVRRREEQPSYQRRRHEDSPASLVPLAAAMAAAAALLQGWRWYEAGEWALIAAAGSGLLVGIPVIAALAVRLLRRPGAIGARVVAAKLTGPLVAARLDVLACGPDRSRLRALAVQAAAAYAAYDDPAGGALRPERPRPIRGRHGNLPLLLNTGEAAALWHLPEAEGTPPRVRRTTARRLAPAPGHATQGIRLGVSAADPPVPVHLPAPMLHRNHFLVAKTRRGKSTLLRHIAAGLMERVAAGVEDTALVVVDPHQDLAEAVLAAVPPALADRTVYLDFAHLERPIGLNLIDVALFPDRDKTVESVVTIMNRLWPANWGPRMEGALRASLSALHEINTRRSRVDQFTLLDVAPFLTNKNFRDELLREVEDVAVAAWWRDNFTFAGRVLQQQTANPVTSKIGRFTVTEASRLVLGQPRSTFDPRSIIRDGGVLVVNTAVGTLGEGAASLVGATVLNLLGLLIEEQVVLPPEARRRVVQLVDESSTLGAVDYPRMLSELGKYGASFTLVTQALSKLDTIDRDLLPTILANSDGLTVFGASAEDARRLLPELGGDLEIEDVVSLDDFSAHARWWDGFGRPPALTFRVDPPPPADPARTRALAERSAARYGRPRAQVIEEISEILAARFPKETGDGRAPLTAEELASASKADQSLDADAGTSPTARTDAPEGGGPVRPVARTRNHGGRK